MRNLLKLLVIPALLLAQFGGSGLALAQYGGTGPNGMGGSGPYGTGGSWPRPSYPAVPQYAQPPTYIKPWGNGGFTIQQPGQWPTFCTRVGQSLVCR